jgi:hypothetical protein
MKFSVFQITFCALALCFIACKNEDKAVRDAARESLGVSAQETPAIPTSNATPPSSAPINGVQHYTCPNNCAGSGAGEAGTCPVCGTAYVHNASYHDQQQPQIIPPANADPASGAVTPPITPPTPEPAQNAAGVWHYTCANGCAGGAGAAGTCAKCGGALAHNTAYHQ